jgi:hypothetical protein
MGEFTLLGFVAFIPELVHHVDEAKHHALETAAKIVEAESKSVIGTHGYNWPPLSASTIAKHGDTPLLNTGEMRESISHNFVSHNEVTIGSGLDRAVYQELGTSTIPPRSFLAQAAIHKEREITELIGHQVIKALVKG